MAKSSKKAKDGGSSKKARARRPETENEKLAREASAADAGKVHAVRMISAKALKDAVRDINAILEENSTKAGDIGGIKRACTEKGMDPVALGLLVRLYRKGQNNTVKLRSILDSFDYGRDVLGLDKTAAADIFLDEKLGKKRSRKEAAEIDPNQADIKDEIADGEAGESGDEPAENVHSLDEHRQAAAS